MTLTGTTAAASRQQTRDSDSAAIRLACALRVSSVPPLHVLTDLGRRLPPLTVETVPQYYSELGDVAVAMLQPLL